VKSRQLLAEICLLFRFDDGLEEPPGAIVDVIGMVGIKITELQVVFAVEVLLMVFALYVL